MRRSARPRRSAVAMMSRSRNVSRRRRTLPASETWSAAGMLAERLDRPRARPAAPGRAAAAPAAFGFGCSFERLEDVLLDLRRRARSACAAAPARPPACSSASVVTPSSCQIRRAVFGPRPGQAHERDDVGRDRARSRFASASISPVLDDLDDLLLDRLADPLAAPSPCRRARAARSSRRSRGSAAPRAGRRARGTSRCPRARAGRRAARTARPPLRSAGGSSPLPR